MFNTHDVHYFTFHLKNKKQVCPHGHLDFANWKKIGSTLLVVIIKLFPFMDKNYYMQEENESEH